MEISARVPSIEDESGLSITPSTAQLNCLEIVQETTPHYVLTSFGRLFYLVNLNLRSQVKVLKLGRRS